MTVKTCGFRTIWNSSREPPEPREPRDPAKWWQDPQLGPPIPHAPGARMTAVTQTPSNDDDGDDDSDDDDADDDDDDGDLREFV